MNYDFLNTKNKIEGLTLIIQEYQFLTQEVLNNKEYFKFRLTQEAQQRELELFKLSGIEKCISDFKENDLEKCFLWTDEESKKEYLSSVRYNIEQSLKASISYALKTNVEIDEFSDSFLLLKNDYNILIQINELVKKELVKLKYDYMSFYRENLKLYDSYDVELTENQKEFKRHLINELKEVENSEVNTHNFWINITPEKITNLQNQFKGYKGKKLAILIYILNKEYNVLFIDENSRKKGSRSFFIRHFMNDNDYNTNGVGNFFEGATGNLKISNIDPAYESIKKLVSGIINKPD